MNEWINMFLLYNFTFYFFFHLWAQYFWQTKYSIVYIRNKEFVNKRHNMWMVRQSPWWFFRQHSWWLYSRHPSTGVQAFLSNKQLALAHVWFYLQFLVYFGFHLFGPVKWRPNKEACNSCFLIQFNMQFSTFHSIHVHISFSIF